MQTCSTSCLFQSIPALSSHCLAQTSQPSWMLLFPTPTSSLSGDTVSSIFKTDRESDHFHHFYCCCFGACYHPLSPWLPHPPSTWCSGFYPDSKVILWKCKSDYGTPLLKGTSVSSSRSAGKPNSGPLP